MATWPSSLPERLLAEGYQETPPELTLRSETDVGPGKARRRSTAGARLIRGGLRLTAAQRATLDAFYVTDTQSGALAFDWVHPVTQAACSMMFRAPPEYAARSRGLYFTAGLDLEILP